MRDAILSFPNQLAQGIDLGKAHRIERPYHPPRVDESRESRPGRIISCGMGGSAIAGEMLSMVIDTVIVHWDYDLPVSANPSDLVICTSWSGETEETISSYLAACARDCEILVITTGGKLAELALTNNSPLIILPADDIPPRTATGYMAGALFGALGMHETLPTALDPAAMEQQGKDLAAVLGGATPVIYSSYPWRKLTGFWKMAYSETAKRHVFANWFPSGAHTEIVGWEGPYQNTLTPVIVRDTNENERYAANFDALLALLSEKGYTVSTVELSGSTSLGKVFNNYILALWTSYYVAHALYIDPNATELLDEFKKLKASL